MQIRIENTGGHIAHLAGAFFGFIFIKLLQNGIDMSKMGDFAAFRAAVELLKDKANTTVADGGELVRGHGLDLFTRQAVLP